jgi:hypothetical protein
MELAYLLAKTRLIKSKYAPPPFPEYATYAEIVHF